MLKLFGKKYVEYGEIYQFLQDEYEFNHGLFQSYLKLAETIKHDEDSKKFHLEEADKYLKAAYAISEAKYKLYQKYGRV